ncbi:glycosyl hydrolase family 28 protein [Saccharicrinis sp. FJH62]|uniref:glycosyl hydrolase family 28 protein n=1 Tax=Saccharicrinis sp. FJH62 TaxID=3344657 RepID=UPI0035D4B20F
MNKYNQPIALLFLLLLTSLYTINLNATIEIYPFPPNAILSNVFTLDAEGQTLDVVRYMDYHVVHFGFDRDIQLSIQTNEEIKSYKISPLSLNAVGTVEGKRLTFNLSPVSTEDETPSYLIIQINHLEKLIILGDKLEENVPASSGDGIYNVTKEPYNADPTGAVFAQQAIQQAIDDAASSGGGIVYVPWGFYQIKENLALKSNVELYLAPGSILKAINDRSQYIQNATLPPAFIIHNAANVKITGRGAIDASGFNLMSPPPGFTTQSVEHPRRRALQCDSCDNLLINGITVKDGSGWTIELMRSTNIKVQNVKVLNHKDIKYKIQNDGIDIVSSSHTTVNQCFVITIDDAMCSKARYGDMNDCVFTNNVNYCWSGGVKAGMQSNGNMADILFRNCDVIHCRRGIGVDTREGEDPIVGVEFRDIRIEETEPTVSGENYCVDFESKLAPISDIHFVRISCTGNNKIRFRGSYDITNILFEQLEIDGAVITSPRSLNLTKDGNMEISFDIKGLPDTGSTIKPILETSEKEKKYWRYTTNPPAPNWYKSTFNDSAWNYGKGGFGSSGTPGATIGTVWQTNRIWIRKKFKISHREEMDSYQLILRAHHDEEFTVYVNGQKIISGSGYSSGYGDYLFKNINAGNLLTDSINTVAIQCIQTTGGQFIDVGISVLADNNDTLSYKAEEVDVSYTLSGQEVSTKPGNGFFYYPNPAHDKLFFHNTPDRPYAIEIYALNGRSLLSDCYTMSNSMDVSFLKPGIYIVRVSYNAFIQQFKFTKL